jgi:hypothetical protein
VTFFEAFAPLAAAFPLAGLAALLAAFLDGFFAPMAAFRAA